MIYYILNPDTLHRRAPYPYTGRQNEGNMFIMNDEKTPAAKTGASARTAPAPSECTLAELPVGRSAVVINMKPSLRGKKKFADVGIVPGTLLEMEAHAPFGGLLRIKVMESSLSIHRDDAANIIIRLQERP